jgi:hypothetical protein
VAQGYSPEATGFPRIFHTGSGSCSHEYVLDRPAGRVRSELAVAPVTRATDTAVAGDVVDNQTHAPIGFAGPCVGTPRGPCREAHPNAVVAGHTRPASSDWEASRPLDETRS